MKLLSRRGIIGGLVGIVAAPAIVRVASIMPVRSLDRMAWFAFGDEDGLHFIDMTMEEVSSQNLAMFLFGIDLEGTWE